MPKAMFPVSTARRFSVMGSGRAKGSKVAGGVIVGGAGYADIFVNDRVAFFLELLGEHVGQGLEPDAHHAERGAHRQGILFHLVTAVVRQFGNGQGAELHSVRGRARLDRVSVVHHRRAGAQ